MDYLSPGTQPPGSKDDAGIKLKKYKELMTSRPFTLIYLCISIFLSTVLARVWIQMFKLNSLELHEMELSSGYIIKHPVLDSETFKRGEERKGFIYIGLEDWIWR